ncbi:MAG: response regulator [Deltaproteobacteria bacterium]|nr:response regulator [Deltaproteobacteria bacterium]
MKIERPKTILIVEDDQGVLAIMEKYLRHAGYEVIAAHDGMEGLKKVRQGGYDLVITDIVMPYVSGAGVLSAVKERNPSTPVIVMTGFGLESHSVAVEKRADLVLSKPVKMAKILEYVRNFLNLSQGELGSK